MRTNFKINILTLKMVAGIISTRYAQEYVSPTKPYATGSAPGMKVKLLDSSNTTRTYVLVFKHGDEVIAGITAFAQAYKVKSAHYTGVGDATSAKVGWYDYQRKQFKVIPIDTAEITSFVGNITMFNNKPVAHTHINLATADGISHGGHLLSLLVGPTLELFVTVEPAALYKKLDPEFDAATIDTSSEQ